MSGRPCVTQVRQTESDAVDGLYQRAVYWRFGAFTTLFLHSTACGDKAYRGSIPVKMLIQLFFCLSRFERGSIAINRHRDRNLGDRDGERKGLTRIGIFRIEMLVIHKSEVEDGSDLLRNSGRQSPLGSQNRNGWKEWEMSWMQRGCAARV